MDENSKRIKFWRKMKHFMVGDKKRKKEVRINKNIKVCDLNAGGIMIERMKLIWVELIASAVLKVQRPKKSILKGVTYESGFDLEKGVV
jgi:hypothetical protein